MNWKHLLSSAALGLIVGTSALAAEGHHHHGDGAPARLQLNAGQKWATDAALRQSMASINQAMATALPAIHKNRFGNADYDALAASVRQHVATAVEQCKLAPEADAMLHLVIAELLAGAEAMEGKAGGERHDGAVRVVRALDAYGRYFRHPGWKTARG